MWRSLEVISGSQKAPLLIWWDAHTSLRHDSCVEEQRFTVRLISRGTADVFALLNVGGNRPINAHIRNLLTCLEKYGALMWLGFVLSLTTWFGWQHQREIREILVSLRTAEPVWLTALVGLEIAILAVITLTYRLLLKQFGYTVGLPVLLDVHLQRIVVSTVTPLGGPSSIAIFVHRLRQHGVQVADSLLAVSVKSVIGNIAFLMVLLPILFFQDSSVLLVASTTGLIVLVLSTAWLLSMALSGRRPPRWVIRRLPRRALRFLADARSRQLSPRSMLRPFIYMLATKLAGALMLLVALKAAGQTPGIEVPLMAYVVGMVFLLVAPVFQGIGIVEVSMAVALERLGVPAAAAVSATLLTRVAELWLPLLAGIIMQIGGFAAARRKPSLAIVVAPQVSSGWEANDRLARDARG